jgi:mono/diheme cytochrome c family protein
MKLGMISLTLAFMLPMMTSAQQRGYTLDLDWHAPQNSAARENPLKENSEVTKGGRKLFSRNCAECHGEQGLGSERAPGLHLGIVQGQTDGALFWKITNGNPGRGMPSWSRLPEGQRWQLVLFLRTLARTPSEPRP